MDDHGRPQKQIVVQSFVGATYFKSDVPWACISVVTEDGNWPEISAANRVDLLQLSFADAIYPDSTGLLVLFGEEDAHRILDFVKAVWDRIDLLMVHCEAGISRSSAIAAVVSRIYYGDDAPFVLSRLYEPNPLVYRIMVEVAVERGDYSG
jgi:predicted protein tyrosine phosphatase